MSSSRPSRRDCARTGTRRFRTRRTGVAFHSLRAVPLPVLTRAARVLRELAADLPLHIHVAEQVKEVESCLAHTGRRPVELLLDTGLIDPHWCLVHATHSTAAELRGIADAGASVCVSITTEANLGDGFFDAARFLKLGGRMCVGSDSQSTVSPAEELRWMEYQARLRKRRRGVLADRAQTHVGTRLWRDAAREGARAIGQPAGVIEVGARADWVVLDPRPPEHGGRHRRGGPGPCDLRRGQRGDSRRDGGRPLGDQERPARARGHPGWAVPGPHAEPDSVLMRRATTPPARPSRPRAPPPAGPPSGPRQLTVPVYTA